jgi:exopolysaccharide biosynthesis protein
MVLSLGPTLLPNVPAVQPGTAVKLVVATEPDLTGVEVAIGGRTVLLRQGKAPDWGTASQPRHPRTVIGWNETHFFLIVVDGRRKGFSAGMTYPELSQLAAELGCTDALNLDGGGSSTLWLGGKVMNLPSDGVERPVANALLVLDVGVPGR